VPEARQWLVTGWHDVHTVLTDTERFTTDQPASPMHGLCGGTPMLLREGESHQDVREAFRHDYDAHRVNDYVDTIARPVAHRVADVVFPAGCADLAADYFEPVGYRRGHAARRRSRWRGHAAPLGTSADEGGGQRRARPGGGH
jgi:cytochrome P450